MALRFTFRDSPITIKNKRDADPQVIGTTLLTIQNKNNGNLTWDIARQDVSNRRNPLHRHFEWNDKIAAEKHRHDQFNELVRLVIRDDPDDASVKPQRAFHSIHDVDGTSYRFVDEVLRSADLQLKLMESARRDLLAWQNRYAELADVCALVAIAEQRLQAGIERANRRSRARVSRVAPGASP